MTQFVTDANFAMCSAVEPASTGGFPSLSISSQMDDDASTDEMRLAQEAEEARAFSSRHMWSDAFVTLLRATETVKTLAAKTEVASVASAGTVDADADNATGTGTETDSKVAVAASDRLGPRALLLAVQVLIELSTFLILAMNRPVLRNVLDLADKLLAREMADGVDAGLVFARIYLQSIVALRRTFAHIEAGKVSCSVVV